MKVYMLETSEPLYCRFETGLKDALSIYATRELAESACKNYNGEFQDEIPACVVEFDVVGSAGPKTKNLDRYVLRHKTLKSYVTDETPEDSLTTILGWSNDVGDATEVGPEDDEHFNSDVFNIVGQLCAEDSELRPSDLELVRVETVVEPTNGEYSVVGTIEPAWFTGSIDELEDEESDQNAAQQR